MTPLEVALLLDAVRTVARSGGSPTPELDAYLTRSIDALQRAPEVPEQGTPVQLQSYAAEKQARYRARKASAVTETVTNGNALPNVLPNSSLHSPSLFLQDSEEIQKEKEGEHEREKEKTLPESVTPLPESVTRIRVVAERPPPEDTPQAELDAWCEARGLPVGHPAMPYFLAEQSNAKPKRSWKRTWARHVERLTLIVQEEAAKRARLSGQLTLGTPRSQDERPAPYHQEWRPPRANREEPRGGVMPIHVKNIYNSGPAKMGGGK